MGRLTDERLVILSLPTFGDPRFCGSFDEDCNDLDHARCYIGGVVEIKGELYETKRSEKPCPYLD